MMALRFLLLEDSALDAELIRTHLDEMAVFYRLVHAQGREDFLAALGADPFDLILSDFSLPDFDGISALRLVQERCPQVPFILVSATLGEELAIDALKQGATDYVLKQRLQRLVPAVQRALREARERRERQQAQHERDELLLSLQHQAEQLTQANQIKDEFLAVLSHELRTPLNPILGWSKLLRTRNYDAATTSRVLEIIERNAKVQAQLIDDLLDISRILQGKLVLDRVPVDMMQILGTGLAANRLAVEAKAIALTVDVGDYPAALIENEAVGCQRFLVLGDANRLQQVLWNLLSNAVKFTPQGGQVTIQIECIAGLLPIEPMPNCTADQQDAYYIQITISDTGIGISSEFLPHVFDYFRQADSSTTRSFGGLGLGLAIAHHIIQAHGGLLRVDSAGLGQGATFTLALPLLRVSDRLLETDSSLTSPTEQLKE